MVKELEMSITKRQDKCLLIQALAQNNGYFMYNRVRIFEVHVP